MKKKGIDLLWGLKTKMKWNMSVGENEVLNGWRKWEKNKTRCNVNGREFWVSLVVRWRWRGHRMQKLYKSWKISAWHKNSSKLGQNRTEKSDFVLSEHPSVTKMMFGRRDISC